MTKVARYDIHVNSTPDFAGTYDVIPAGSKIDAKYADLAKEQDWEGRGLIGDEVAVNANETLTPAGTTSPKEVTQEEVDAELKAIAERAAKRQQEWNQSQTASQEEKPAPKAAPKQEEPKETPKQEAPKQEEKPAPKAAPKN